MLQEGYCFMPNTVLYSKELTDKQKLLFWAISNLCAEKGYCRASNDYLWELLDADERTIRRNVSALQEMWFINIVVKNWNQREITLQEEPGQKCPGGRTKMSGGVGQKCPHNNTSIILQEKEIYKEKKSIPSVSELVEAYKNNPLLVEKIGDVDVVRERAEYKQAKKNRAYKTVSWFIQQLVVCIETVRFWMPRGDTAQRLRFALNQTCEREWKSVYWNETIEQEYQSWKRNLALTLNKWIQI